MLLCCCVAIASIDIALDHVHEEGIRDWAYLFPLLESPNTGSIYVATVVDGFTAGCEEALKRCGLMGTDRVAYFRTAWTERAMEWHDGHTINCLAAFISAHLRAQRLVKYYLGESAEVVTEEESLVVEESNTVVDLAKHMLMGIDNNTICYHVSKQVARIIVHTQEDIIHTLSKEGILTDKDAEVLLAETRVNQRMLKRNWLGTLFDRDGR